MKVLLDTQALIWALIDSNKLTKTARAFIQEADTVYVSPINFYEIAIKTALGRNSLIKWSIHNIIQEATIQFYMVTLISQSH